MKATVLVVWSWAQTQNSLFAFLNTVDFLVPWKPGWRRHQCLYFNLLLKAEAAQHLYHVAQGFVQWGLEYFQWGRFHSPPEQLDPVHCYVLVEKKPLPLTAGASREQGLPPLAHSNALKQHRMLLDVLALLCQWSVRASSGQSEGRDCSPVCIKQAKALVQSFSR